MNFYILHHRIRSQHRLRLSDNSFSLIAHFAHYYANSPIIVTTSYRVQLQ